MKVYRGFCCTQYPNEKGTVVSVGTFDGVHLAHKAIIDSLVEKARHIGAQSTVVTFDPHPRVFFGRDEGLNLVSSEEEKLFLLDSLGLDKVIIQPFDKEFAGLSSLDFLEKYLIQKLNTKAIVVGYDHSFGRERENAYEFLSKAAKSHDIEVIRLERLEVDGHTVSSSSVRRAIKAGDFSTANLILGYTYSFCGEVIHGKQLGRTLGYPTANILLDEPLKLIPPDGVYLVRVFLQGQGYYGMMNCGMRPTLNDYRGRTIEVNIFDFDSDIYGEKLTVEPIQRIRGELKFDSLFSLTARLGVDKLLCKEKISKL